MFLYGLERSYKKFKFDMKNIFKFDFSNFRGDLFGGVTAGIVALPLALAFGEQSGLGADAGLYGAIFIAFFAAWLGGTNTQISGPTAPMTAVSMVVITGMVAAFDGDMDRAVPAILAIFVIAGIMEILLGIFGIGKYIRFIPYPVVSGFMTGIGVIIIITQLLPFLGYYPQDDTAFINEMKPQAQEVLIKNSLEAEQGEAVLTLDHYQGVINKKTELTPEIIEAKATKLAEGASKGVIGSLKQLGRAFQNMKWLELILALVTMFIIYGFKRITTKIPSALVALVVVTGVAYFAKLDYAPITEIPSGFPVFRSEIFIQFDLGQVTPFIVSAMMLAALGAIDSLLTSIVADNMTKTKHNPKQELIGQGVGNMVAAFFGGIPGAGATIRTVVNIQAGGTTRISGMVAGILLLVILLALGPTASKIPAAVLAGILMTVGIGVMDYKGLKHMNKMPVEEVSVMIIVLVLTVFVGLVEAVIIGMVLSSILFMKKTSDVVEHKTKSDSLQSFSREIPWADEGDLVKRHGDEVYIKHLDGALFFGFASRFQDLVNNLPKIKVVIIRMDLVPYVDQSGLYAMEDAVMELQSQGILVVYTDLHGQPKDMLESINLVPGLVPRSYCFENFSKCVLWLEAFLDGRDTEPFLEVDDDADVIIFREM